MKCCNDGIQWITCPKSNIHLGIFDWFSQFSQFTLCFSQFAAIVRGLEFLDFGFQSLEKT